ncbi:MULTISPECIES: hypothetical protein [unclassified Pseudodesulfovibrio]|uniref:hypothetical protein n=1 Tax=unclassified Pseudodesulfovibrio TaxID=2661612 RepID=UPI0013E2D429|nr:MULTISPECIES: hypothetical protein [unclassified Pseudodesulfovibrio]MCJ2163893.1 hypothetical protein [Pseudodesulfovibrio sp. S3-i]
MMIHGETVHSPLPMDLPWWMPDHFVFFGVLYIVLGIIGVALAVTVMQSLRDAKQADH